MKIKILIVLIMVLWSSCSSSDIKTYDFECLVEKEEEIRKGEIFCLYNEFRYGKCKQDVYKHYNCLTITNEADKWTK